MVNHYPAQVIENDEDENGDEIIEYRSHVKDRPPRITNKEGWDEDLSSVYEVSNLLDSAVIRKEEVGDYPPTVYDVFYGFDFDTVKNDYNPPTVLSDGPSVDDMETFICCWSAISKYTEPFRIVSSPTERSWPNVHSIRQSHNEPIMFHAYCIDGSIGLYKYNVITEEETLFEPSHLQNSVEEILIN